MSSYDAMKAVAAVDHYSYDDSLLQPYITRITTIVQINSTRDRSTYTHRTQLGKMSFDKIKKKKKITSEVSLLNFSTAFPFCGQMT